PDPDAMARNFGALGLAHAEALSFALARDMPRPEAQALVKSLISQAKATGAPLRELAEKASGHDLAEIFDPARQLGQAPAEARAFAAAAKAI
ncbi:MAG: adenylosuccinate lyase family protein, partial [Alphaproteobacteria bacterium]|nr:adenylosuccinate lyase family protein [Alphaproteobacteria bacterium]